MPINEKENLTISEARYIGIGSYNKIKSLFKEGLKVVSMDDHVTLEAESAPTFYGAVGDFANIKCKGIPVFYSKVGDNATIECDGEPEFHSKVGKNLHVINRTKNPIVAGAAVKGNLVVEEDQTVTVRASLFKM